MARKSDLGGTLLQPYTQPIAPGGGPDFGALVVRVFTYH
jgi:hypothetical protein